MDNHTPPQSIAITVAVIFVVFLAIAVTIAAAVTVGPAVVRRRKKRSNDTIPPILSYNTKNIKTIPNLVQTIKCW